MTGCRVVLRRCKLFGGTALLLIVGKGLAILAVGAGWGIFTVYVFIYFFMHFGTLSIIRVFCYSFIICWKRLNKWNENVQSINDQSINYLFNQSIKQNNRSINQSNNQAINKSNNQAIKQTNKHIINQSVS